MNPDFSNILSIIESGNLIVNSLLWEDCSIVLTARQQNKLENFVLRFHDVVDVEIRTGPYNNFTLVGLQIEDISSYHMEGKNIRVASEDDQGYLFFYCNSLEIVEDKL